MTGWLGIPVRDEATGRLRIAAVTALPLVVLIRLYQVVLSPLTGPTCRFYPSCSAYAVTALGRHGPLRGGWLMIRRLARCHPWNPGGVDHVPPRGSSRAHPHDHHPIGTASRH